MLRVEQLESYIISESTAAVKAKPKYITEVFSVLFIAHSYRYIFMNAINNRHVYTTRM